MRRFFLLSVLAVVCTAGGVVAAEDGPITITGHVASNTLIGGSLVDVPVGAPVRMFFQTRRGGFDPFWGPTGHFCSVDEVSFELHAGSGAGERVAFSAASGGSLLFTNAGFVTSAVSQDVIEFFQMALDSQGYSVYFKAQDLDASVGWTTPLVCGLPASTPASAFAFATGQPNGSCTYTTPNPSRGCWYVQQQTQVPVTPAPVMTIAFDGAISVAHTGCKADFNEDGILTVQDIFDFLEAWFGACNGSTACSGRFADFNCSNTITVQDIFDFLSAWFAGC